MKNVTKTIFTSPLPEIDLTLDYLVTDHVSYSGDRFTLEGHKDGIDGYWTIDASIINDCGDYYLSARYTDKYGDKPEIFTWPEDSEFLSEFERVLNKLWRKI